jgi:hypothetical protein
MTGFCGAILNSYGRFAVPAFTPVFLNLSLIGAALVASTAPTSNAAGTRPAAFCYSDGARERAPSKPLSGSPRHHRRRRECD